MNHELKAAELRVALLRAQQELLHYKELLAQKELERLQEQKQMEKQEWNRN